MPATWMLTTRRALALAVAYAVTGWLGLSVASSPGNVTALWPPSGIALALLLVWGRRAAPGVFLGSLVTNAVFFPVGAPGSAGSVAGAALIAAGSTLELVTAAWLVERFAGHRRALASPGRALTFAAAALAAAALAATVGLASTAALGGVHPGAFGRFWLTWWLGDSLGMLAVTPLALRDDAPLRPPRRLEWAGSLGLTVVLAQLLLGRPLPLSTGTSLQLAWLLLPGVIWAGVRLGGPGVAVQTLLIHVLVSWSTVLGQGPFAPYPGVALLLVDSLLAAAVLPGLLLVATIARSERAQADLEEERRGLERRVAERTAAVEAESRERARLAASLLEAQKQEAVGRLAGAVAHDFNNLLTVIVCEASLLKAQRLPPSQHDSAQMILATTMRAAELTRNLLAVARRPLQPSRAVDVAATVGDLRRLLRPALPESIALEVEGRGEPATAAIDRGQLEQVLLNLALNARDAMPRGGRLTIAHGARELDGAAAQAAGVAPGAWAVIEVSDAGEGIPPEVLPRIFEPFFTTKAARGTGLGLSSAAELVSRAGGRLTVRSAVGAGSTFTVWLPAAAGPAEADAPEAPPEPAAAPSGRTILVAEDEPLVRRTVVATLRRQGHAVLEAADGEEALALARQRADVDLLVTDLVMPRLGGLDLLRSVRARGPMPALLLSGYHEHQAEAAGERLLAKPFTPEQLIQAVAAALRAPPGGLN